MATKKKAPKAPDPSRADDRHLMPAVLLRAPAETIAAWKRRAKAAGLTLSAWVRRELGD